MLEIYKRKPQNKKSLKKSLFTLKLIGGPRSLLFKLFSKNRIYIDVSERAFCVCFNLKFATPNFYVLNGNKI